MRPGRGACVEASREGERWHAERRRLRRRGARRHHGVPQVAVLARADHAEQEGGHLAHEKEACAPGQRGRHGRTHGASVCPGPGRAPKPVTGVSHVKQIHISCSTGVPFSSSGNEKGTRKSKKTKYPLAIVTRHPTHAYLACHNRSVPKLPRAKARSSTAYAAMQPHKKATPSG